MNCANPLHLPFLTTGDDSLDKAFRMALGDLLGNILPYQGGLLEEPRAVIIAGLDYVTPWTRDAAINSWFAGNLLLPAVAKDTLLAVLERSPKWGLIIGGEYWDAVIWTTGAWDHYLATQDGAFLKTALEATRNTLAMFDEEEFDPQVGLYRGGACFQDGIAGYPDYYTAPGASSGIKDWPARNPDTRPVKGHGLPMFALSTNCLYYNACVLAGEMARALGQLPDAIWARKAKALRDTINLTLWDENIGNYHYMTGPHGDCPSQEGLGSAFAILFGVADARQTARILQTQHVDPAGIPCVWPGFERYAKWERISRHAGTVWPQVQGFWALAALGSGGASAFLHELRTLAKHANRDAQFTEIYHPATGQIDGGMQERGEAGIIGWESCRRQTWSATAFLAMILRGVCGLQFVPEGLRLNPMLPAGLGGLRLQNIHAGNCTIHLNVQGRGDGIKSMHINLAPATEGLIPNDLLRGPATTLEVDLVVGD